MTRPPRDRKQGTRPNHMQQERRRSTEPPLWTHAWPFGLAAVLIGFPIVRDATADKMQRKVFANQASCECAYTVVQCTRRSDGRWVGPWYATRAEDRLADDPGEGRRCETGGRVYGSGGGYYGGAYNSDVRPATGLEAGHRGGFGGTGRVRAGS